MRATAIEIYGAWALGVILDAMHLPPCMPAFRHFCRSDEECRCEEEYQRAAEQRCDEARERDEC